MEEEEDRGGGGDVGSTKVLMILIQGKGLVAKRGGETETQRDRDKEIETEREKRVGSSSHSHLESDGGLTLEESARSNVFMSDHGWLP